MATRIWEDPVLTQVPFRRITRLIAVAALCSACGPLRRPGPAEQPTCPMARIALARWAPSKDTGAVEVRVIAVANAQDSGYAPVRNGLLSVRSRDLQRSEATDSLGRAKISALPAAQYVVTVRGLGFERRVDTLRLSDEAGWQGSIRLSSTVQLCCRAPICL